MILHSGKKNVERIRRTPSHGVATLGAFGIDQGNPFRDYIDSLLIDTPHLKGTLTIELSQVNTVLLFNKYFTWHYFE